MNNDDKKKDYLTKIKLIKKHNKYYHEKDRPTISDQAFDLLKKEIIDLEDKYDFLRNKESPTKTVGFKPSKNFKKVKHKVPMLSLGNAFNEADLINFEKKNKKFFKFEKFEYY
jgi:DNA ligase (NAD+)